jgi:eukaryotic-like serine/threonine-protein kinase
MHARRVVHGNVKPGNVFFSAEGEVLLSDWAMGNMPGLAQFEFTDAVLYQSPEQLCDPSGYLEEDGYRWDVYTFGVLAYRILTGNFPRCHETFKQVAPPSGETWKEGLKAELGKIAKNLKAQPSYTWPKRAQNGLEVELRAWVDRCLPLDPAQRPATMMEVVAGFEALDQKTAEESERVDLGALQGKAKFQTKLAWGFAGLTAAAAALGFISLSRQSLAQQAEVKQARTEKALAEKSLAALKSGAEV